MPKLDPATFKTMPWKNGGGTTVEMLTLPPGADLDSFELRISMASVAASGPFSIFARIDRTLVVTEGAGVVLQLAGDTEVTLDPTSSPFAFSGDEPVQATLVDGSIVDFNVMTRRSALRHHTTRVSVESDVRFACTGELSLLLVLDGSVASAAHVLTRGDIFTASANDPLLVVHPTTPKAELLRVDVFRLP